MSLGSGEWLLGGKQNTSGAYHMTLTTPIPTAFQLVAMGFGNDGVYDVTLDLRNNRVGV